jgi:hypothetical protein
MADDKDKDLEVVIVALKLAKKDRLFGEITLSFRDGHIQYVRNNKIEKIEELELKHKTLDKK